MCDTLCSIRTHATFFAKNSDRPVGEAQLVRWFEPRPASSHPLRAQYIDLGPDPGAFGFLGSQPVWLWGVEHGVNQHGVAIGNEKIWSTTDPRPKPAALLGMDIVRLALERATNAEEARGIVCGLVSEFGQGGSGEEHRNEPYDSSFLIADADMAWIVETNHRDWAARRIGGFGAISNRISIAQDWDLCSVANDEATPFDVQRWRPSEVTTAHADHRLRVTTAAAAIAEGAEQIASTLRDHGTATWGNPLQPEHRPAPIPNEIGNDSRGVTVCMHVRDYQTTAASMIVELPAQHRVTFGDRHDPYQVQVWAALGSPCVSIYVPIIAPIAPATLGELEVWRSFDALRVLAEGAPTAAAQIRAAWAPIEARWWQAASAHRREQATAWQPESNDIRNSLRSVFHQFDVG